MRVLRVTSHWFAIERLLRGSAARAPGTRRCLAIGTIGAALHGAALGAGAGAPAMVFYGALKVPLLMLLTTAVCLPSFYVVNAVLGLRDDFAAACRGLLAGQATMGLALGAMAPIVAFYLGTVHDADALTLLCGVLFSLATWGGHQVVLRHYEPLLRRDRRHRFALRGWLLLYVFFAIQLAWVLRPFLGTPGYGVAFMRTTAFEQNAYVVLLEHVARLLR